VTRVRARAVIMRDLAERGLGLPIMPTFIPCWEFVASPAAQSETNCRDEPTSHQLCPQGWLHDLGDLTL